MNLRLHYREFITTKTRYSLGFINATLQSFCKFLQQQIAGRVAKRVVYLLKLIKRNEEHTQHLTRGSRGRNGLRQTIFKKSAIWKLRNSVVISEPIYLSSPLAQQALELLLVAPFFLKQAKMIKRTLNSRCY